MSKTLEEWVQSCRDALDESGAFFGHGTGSAHDEAAWLVLAAIGARVDGGFQGWSRRATGTESGRIRELLEQRISKRVPLAYLTGEAWFCGLKFAVDRSVPIPRSPIAELVKQNFSPWAEASKLRNVLDLCTGSGCIGIATAHYLPWLRVDLSDVSEAALRVAGMNAKRHELEERVDIVHSDLFGGLQGRRYDLIVSNPPYVSRAAWEALPAEYHAEPESALVSGLSGLELPLEILARSVDFLTPEGVLICEVGENAELLQEWLPGLPMTWIEFQHGGEGVFTIDRQRLLAKLVEVRVTLEKLRNVV